MCDSFLHDMAKKSPIAHQPWRCATFSLLIGLLALACASEPKVHQRKWIEVSTPNFQIMSTMHPLKATNLAIDLERFLVIVEKFTNAPMHASPIPTKIFAFQRKRNFHHFTRSTNVAGWMMTGMRSNTIALAEYHGMDSSQVIGHEYVHYILNNATSIQYPTWYNEGLAEYTSTLEVRANR